MEEINEQLAELRIEDYIWIIFIFVSIAAIVSDYFEKDWLLTKNKKNYQTYKNINVTLLTISFIVYLYFVLLSYKKYKQTRHNKSIKELFFSEVNLFAASLFLIGGLLNIYTEVKSNVGDADIFL